MLSPVPLAVVDPDGISELGAADAPAPFPELPDDPLPPLEESLLFPPPLLEPLETLDPPPRRRVPPASPSSPRTTSTPLSPTTA